MADLGTAVDRITGKYPRLRFCPQLPITGVRVLGDPAAAMDYRKRLPVFAMVASPVPSAGDLAFEVYTPGTLTFERPVAAGQTITGTVKARKNSDYVVSGIIGGLPKVPVSFLPRIELEYAGVIKTATMPDNNDTYNTLTTASIVAASDGVALLRLIAEGNFGDNLFFLPEAKRPNFAGPKVWWAEPDITAV